jgi:hypothetical protein
MWWRGFAPPDGASPVPPHAKLAKPFFGRL